MPAEQGLPPERRRSCQKQEPESVTIAEPGVFGVALQDDQLLPKEGILGDELRFAAHRIPGGSCKQ